METLQHCKQQIQFTIQQLTHQRPPTSKRQSVYTVFFLTKIKNMNAVIWHICSVGSSPLSLSSTHIHTQMPLKSTRGKREKSVQNNLIMSFSSVKQMQQIYCPLMGTALFFSLFFVKMLSSTTNNTNTRASCSIHLCTVLPRLRLLICNCLFDLLLIAHTN